MQTKFAAFHVANGRRHVGFFSFSAENKNAQQNYFLNYLIFVVDLSISFKEILINGPFLNV